MQNDWSNRRNQSPRYNTMRQKPQFKHPDHFLRTEFGRDEWLCKVCTAFNSENGHPPVLFLKRTAMQHELYSETHQHYAAQWDAQQARKERLGWDTLENIRREEVYDDLKWRTPDARRGRDFVNEFVQFWAKDVALSLNGAQGLRWRDFYEKIAVDPSGWEVPSDVYGKDGWGLVNLDMLPHQLGWAAPPAEEELEHVVIRAEDQQGEWERKKRETEEREISRKKRNEYWGNEPAVEGWVVQRETSFAHRRGKVQGDSNSQRSKWSHRGIGSKRRGGRIGGPSGQRQQNLGKLGNK